jgi:hypothetical protein
VRSYLKGLRMTWRDAQAFVRGEITAAEYRQSRKEARALINRGAWLIVLYCIALACVVILVLTAVHH